MLIYRLCNKIDIVVILDMAEILGKKEINGKPLYYVHYEDCKYSNEEMFFYPCVVKFLYKLLHSFQMDRPKQKM